MKSVSLIRSVLALIDQAYDRRAWHGPNLRGSIRGISAALAAWRPGPKRHCIAEQVSHAAYWKYIARRRLRGDKRGSFAFAGSNWFPLPAAWSEAAWKEYRAILQAEHDILRAAVAELAEGDLLVKPVGSKVSNLALIQGIAAHDIYHAGQIQLLKRLHEGQA